MNPRTFEESCQILGIEPGTSQEERYKAYEDLRTRLQDKRDQAPTSGLKLKYSDALVQIEKAIDCYEAIRDADEFAVFRTVGSTNIEGTATTFSGSEPKAEKRSSERRRKTVRAGLLSLAMLAILAMITFLYQEILEAENKREAVEIARIAEAQATALQAAEDAREDTIRELDVLKQPYLKYKDDIESIASNADNQFAEIKGAMSVAKREGSDQEREVAMFRLETFDKYRNWLREQIDALPALDRIDRIEVLLGEGKLEEAKVLVSEPTGDIKLIEAKFDDALKQQYAIPLERFKIKKAYEEASLLSEAALAQQDFRGALKLLSPFKDVYLGSTVEKNLKRVGELQWKTLYPKAEHAAEIGEFELSRSILDSLESNPEFEKRTQEDSTLVDRLNSEFALELATESMERALERDDFEDARNAMSALANDPNVKRHALEDLRRIDALEEVWKQKQATGAAQSVFNDSSNVLESAVEDAPAGNDFEIPPKLLKKVEPIYPDLLSSNRVSGHVDLEFTVTVDGRVRNVDVRFSSRHEFEVLAIEAVSKWRFRPAEAQGTPVPARVRQKVLFNPK